MTANPNPTFGGFFGSGGVCSSGQQQQQPQQPQQHGGRPPHILSHLWNCGPESSVTATPGPSSNSMCSGPPPPPPPAAQQRVRNFVDGILSPFVNCVQPPLHSCVPSSSSTQHRQSSSSSPPTSSSPWDCSPLRRHVRSPPAVVLSSPLANLQQQHFQQQHAPPFGGTTVTPHENDVLCGRGGSSCRHAGNQNFRLLIAANKSMYVSLTKKQKMMVARQIVDLVHNADPPGRFLAKEGAGWKDIGLPRSLEKTSQALREKSNCDRQEEDEEDHAIISPVCSDDAIEAPLSSKPKVNNRAVEAPVVIIPNELKSIYRPVKDWSTADLSMPLRKATSSASYMPPMTPPEQRYPSETSYPTVLPPFRPSSSSAHADFYPPSIARTPSFPATSVPSSLQQHHYLPHATPPVPLSPIVSSSSSKRHSARSSNIQIQQQHERDLPILPMVTPQREVKRQRTTEGIVGDNHHNTLSSSSTTSWPSVSATANTVSLLSLEDRVIQKPTQVLPSPSRFLQGRVPSRQYTHHHQSLKQSPFLRERSTESDEMAGLTALSTAAFLRLDESLEEA